MSYLIATKGATSRRYLSKLPQKADMSWIATTDWGYEVSVLGRLHTISLSSGDAISELGPEVLGASVRDYRNPRR